MLAHEKSVNGMGRLHNSPFVCLTSPCLLSQTSLSFCKEKDVSALGKQGEVNFLRCGRRNHKELKGMHEVRKGESVQNPLNPCIPCEIEERHTDKTDKHGNHFQLFTLNFQL
jgi:hypothetical protein